MVDKEVASKLDTKHLGDHVEVGHESGLGNDGDVGGVEQLDVEAAVSSIPGGLGVRVHSESLRLRMFIAHNTLTISLNKYLK